MKKITFKGFLTLVLCLFALQTYAQMFQADTPYRLRTAIVSQESYNAQAASNPGMFVYPTARTSGSNVPLGLKEASNATNQLFEFKAITGEIFEYPAGSGDGYQVYNVVAANDLAGSGNGKGVFERNDLTASGQRMRLTGAVFPQNGDLYNVILVSNPVTGDPDFTDVANSVAIIFTAGQPNASTPRRFTATTRFDWLNFGGPAPASVGASWIDSWVLETASGTEVTQLPAPLVLSNKEFDTSSIFISNPVNNQLSIKGLTSNVEQIAIYSLLGKQVLTRNINGQSSLNMDVSALTSGMYLVKMEGDNGAFTKKIIKQ